MIKACGILLATALCASISPALADDAAFLASFAGSWNVKGKFRIATGASPMSVSCSFDAETSATSLSLDGKCRGMVVISRRIGVMLKADGDGVSGSYIGSTIGPAGLSGRREGSAFDLSIRWAKAVNGDRKARIKVEKVGENGMRLITTDVIQDGQGRGYRGNHAFVRLNGIDPPVAKCGRLTRDGTVPGSGPYLTT